MARLAFLLCLLASESLVLSVRYDALSLVNGARETWVHWLGYGGHAAKIGIAFLLAFGLAIGPRLGTWRDELLRQTNGRATAPALIAQFVAYGAFFSVTHVLFADPSASRSIEPLVPLLWMSLLSFVIGLWLVAVAPPGYWLKLARAERFAIGVAAAVAVCAWSIAQYSQQLWSPLSKLTFLVSSALLEFAFQPIVVDADRYVLGTPGFSVQIGAACSGYEGIGLVVIFTSFYLSIFRRDFRFPQALLLYPIGILAIWLFNAVRIVLLIAIGHGLSPALAIGGFHSQAGWISFVLVTVGLLALAYKTPYFSAERPAFRQTAGVDLRVAMLAPLVALLSSTMLTSAVAVELDWFYPVRVLITGAVLIVLWDRYNFLPYRLSPVAIVAGLVVFLLWVVLVPADPEQSRTMSAGLDRAPGFSACLWLLFRLLGSVVTVPLAEELAFRGYLLGRLSGWTFTTGTRLRRSWLALILSSLVFGLLHGAWVAGAIAGLIYGLARYHRDKLADAVVAHAVTNLLLAVYVLTTGAWSLW